MLRTDEKTQIQALDRARPVLPMNPGRAEPCTHDCIRHGPKMIFAALDTATGKVITQCRQRQRHQEGLSFLRLLDRETPDGLDIRFVCDSHATHKRAKARTAQRKRIQVHFIPTYASWLNRVERWLSLLSQCAIKRSTFRSVTELKQWVREFTATKNGPSKPFVWAPTADSIFAKLERLCNKIIGTLY